MNKSRAQFDFLVHVSDATPNARALEQTRKPTFDRRGALIDRSAEIGQRLPRVSRTALVCATTGCGTPIARDSTSRYCRDCESEIAALAAYDASDERIALDLVLLVVAAACTIIAIVYLVV